MKHDWEEYNSRHGIDRRRRCKNCRADQQHSDIQNWGRVVGYSWYPPAGRCRPLIWARATKGRQATQDGWYWVERDECGQWTSHCRDFVDFFKCPYMFDRRFACDTRDEAKYRCETYERRRKRK